MTENSDDHVVCKMYVSLSFNRLDCSHTPSRCRRQVSKYTCPTCNLPYCSLTCFRSPAHADCSETFYKNEIQRDVGENPNLKAEERLKMMEMLKRFEEMENEEDHNDDEEDDGLAERFEGIDLGAFCSIPSFRLTYVFHRQYR